MHDCRTYYNINSSISKYPEGCIFGTIFKWPECTTKGVRKIDWLYGGLISRLKEGKRKYVQKKRPGA